MCIHIYFYKDKQFGQARNVYVDNSGIPHLGI